MRQRFRRAAAALLVGAAATAGAAAPAIDPAPVARDAAPATTSPPRVLSAAGLDFGAAPGPERPLPRGDGLLPDAATLFAQMAIHVAPGNAARFVAGDNRAGWYAATTYAWRNDEGYRSGERSLLAGWAGRVDGRLLDRRSARDDAVLPWGDRIEHDGASEALMLHGGGAALSLRVESVTPARLAVQPLGLPADLEVESAGEVIVLRASGDATSYVAVATDAPARLTPAPADSTLGADAGPLIESRAPRTRLTVHLAWADTPQAAASAARALAVDDGGNAEIGARYARLTRNALVTADAETNRALLWAQASTDSLVVDEFGPGLWAGLPWFRDNWGRDTFIALPGALLATGRLRDARAVLDEFARRQKPYSPDDPDSGRIPNRVARAGVIYNSVDGTPWMIRAGLAYLRYSGDATYVAPLRRLVRAYVDGVEHHHLDRDGLLVHAEADTWMDARIDGGAAWAPRGDRAVEIQALWISALEAGADLARRDGDAAEVRRYARLAQRSRAAFLRRYWDGRRLADRITPQGRADTTLRPNALLALTLTERPLVPDTVAARVLRDTVATLLWPHGLASLDPADPAFHPRHEDPAHHHKDAAYHNGTVWLWNTGFAVSALVAQGRTDFAWPLSRMLAQQLLAGPTRGTLPELYDALPAADGSPHASGTYSQLWSVAEFTRNAYVDYLGFRPDLLDGRIDFVPSLPAAWGRTRARLRFGAEGTLDVDVAQDGAAQVWNFALSSTGPQRIRLDLLARDGARRRVEFDLGAQAASLAWDGTTARLDGTVVRSVAAGRVRAPRDLHYAAPLPRDPQHYPVLRGQDVLKHRLLGTSP